MKAGIIAAGEGQRLRQGGIPVPKPLVPVAGQPLIARVIHAAAKLGASAVACIVNDIHPEVAEYLQSHSWPVPLELVVKTTPSSMESLFQLAPLLEQEPFLMFTVDAVFHFEVVKRFLSEAEQSEAVHGSLAVTTFVDDEKPLWVKMNATQKIIAMGDEARPTPYITAGFYHFSPKIFDLMSKARSLRLTALRQFLALLVDNGYILAGVPVPKTVDVDYPEDIKQAEAYLKEFGDHG